MTRSTENCSGPACAWRPARRNNEDLKAVPRLAGFNRTYLSKLENAIELSGGVRVTATHPPDQAARHTKVALSAVQAHRGTEGSDRFPSTRESKAFATLAIALLAVAGAYTLGAAAVAFAAW